MADTKQLVSQIFTQANITIDGPQEGDIHVHNDQFYRRVLQDGSLGLGESYMDGWWDAKSPDETITKILRTDIKKYIKGNLKILWAALSAKLTNLQSYVGARKVIDIHYDVGNDLYERMLDPSLAYTCAYWKDTQDLAVAQEQKMDLICKKLYLKPGDRVLDIGCGWGNFAKFAAERYGVSVVGVTISKEQIELGRKRCEGLDVELRLQDYRDIPEVNYFDKALSVGMFEHVGYKNYDIYMKTVHRALNDQGMFLLHTIGSPVSGERGDPWLDKYIFPNAVIPSIAQIAKSVENRLIIEDVHNFGKYYDKTLMAWYHNIMQHKQWVIETYGQRFWRMWEYYLLCCAATFRARFMQLWQVVLAKNPPAHVYETFR